MTTIKIEWKTTGDEEQSLPKTLDLPEVLVEKAKEDDSALLDYLSSQYGYLVSDWSVVAEEDPEELPAQDQLRFWDLAEEYGIKQKVIFSVEGLESQSSEVKFIFTDGSSFRLYHAQDCCEDVFLEDWGDIDPKELAGGVLCEFEKATKDNPEYWGDQLWTFYNVRTSRGDVSLRWNGTSNGYYSVSVSEDFEELL